MLELNPGQSDILTSSVADPDPGSGAGSGIVKNRDPDAGSGMNNPYRISETLETIFGVQIFKLFDADLGSGMEKIQIRDGKNSDPGYGINIPDPQHC
jgi:hypothetical protein